VRPGQRGNVPGRTWAGKVAVLPCL
jgi:hypothetical protein